MKTKRSKYYQQTNSETNPIAKPHIIHLCTYERRNVKMQLWMIDNDANSIIVSGATPKAVYRQYMNLWKS